jgi:hypothetical protein
MTIQKLKKIRSLIGSKDQENRTHRDSYKGHRTKKHLLNAIRNEEAEKEIKNTAKANQT